MNVLLNKEAEMSSPKDAPQERRPWGLTPDEWAVVFALFLALLVRVGVLRHVPW